MARAEYLVRDVSLTPAEVAGLARLLERAGVRAELLPGGALRGPGFAVEGGRLAGWGPGAELAVLVKVRGVLASMGLRVLAAGCRLAAAGRGVRVGAAVQGRVLSVSVRGGARPGGEAFLREFEEAAAARGLALKRVRLGVVEQRKRIL